MANGVTGVTVTLKDDLLRKIEKNMERYARLELQVGYYSGETYEDGTPVSAVATFHEFGTSRMPQRSFMRSALNEQRKDLQKVVAQATGEVMTGKDPVRALAKVGRAMARAIYKKLVSADTWAVPLAPSTVAKKGHAKILYETGRLRNALTWRVLDRGRIVAQGKAKNVR